MHLNGKIFEKNEFLKAVEAKVIILIWYEPVHEISDNVAFWHV